MRFPVFSHLFLRPFPIIQATYVIIMTIRLDSEDKNMFKDKNGQFSAGKLIAFIAAIVAVIIVAASCFTVVPAGHTGVERNGFAGGFSF